MAIGAMTFTVSAGLSIVAGSWVAVECVAFPKNFMIGSVTSYTATTLTLNITRVVGGGTFSNWRMVDVTPLYSPAVQSSMQRLHWTSAFSSISTTPALTQQKTFAIPALAQGAEYDNVFQLFAHGQAAACMVEGRIMNLGVAGNHVALAGSVPVWMQTIAGLNCGFGIFVELGCTATHVVAIVKGRLSNDSSSTVSGVLNITIEASVFNFGTAGVLPGGTAGVPLIKHVPGQYLLLGRGRIDTRRRYPRKVDSGHDYSIPKCPTLTIVGSGKTTTPSYAQNEVGWRWRYACDGHVRETQRGWNGTATNGGSAQADVIRIKK
ncbi:MAG: hypothetical protein HOO99_03875 [Hyphomicrobiaceae bacterium]|nr:hypothetical protein [Hyphomicrobiaceae bacterium]